MTQNINIKHAIYFFAFTLLSVNANAQRLFYGDSMLLNNPSRWVGSTIGFFSIVESQVDTCTHEVFIKNSIDEVFGFEIPIYKTVLDTIIITAPIINGNITGKVTFMNKKTKIIFQTIAYNNNKADGQVIHFINNDTITCAYKNGLKEGYEILKTEKTILVTPYLQSKREGQAKKYLRASNKLITTIMFHNNLRDGFTITYNSDNGLISSYLWYLNGKIKAGKYPSLDNDGNIHFIFEYDDNGCLKSATSYSGHKVNNHKEYKCK